MEELHSGFAHLSQAKPIDEIDHPLKRRFDHCSAAADSAESQNCALPQILIATFGDGHIELIGDPGLDSFDDPALAFERVIFGNQQIELQDSHDHEVKK